MNVNLVIKNKNRKRITVATTISGSGLVKAGGSNVVNGLYTCLANYFDVEIIYIAPIQERARRYEIVPGLHETVIPKSDEHVRREREVTEKIHAATTYDTSLMYFLDDTPEYGEALKNSIEGSDMVFIERPYLYNEVKKYINGRPLFQRSQNIEYDFRRSNLPQGNETNLILKDLFELEKTCCSNCDLNFACSEEDLLRMHTLYEVPEKQLSLLPNGVFCSDNPYVSIENRKNMKKKYGLKGEKIATFIGGGHRPNMEACEIILRIADFCPDTSFVFAGNVSKQLMGIQRPSNTILLGTITEKSRKYLFSVTDVALNPMFSGSGSNIKMFDYMASGIPIITSTFGARGIFDKSFFWFADTDEELIDAIHSFELDKFSLIVPQARKMIEEKYDWNVIADGIKELILDYVG